MAAVTYTGTRNLAGDVLGPNLISNGHFTDDVSGWTASGSTLSKTADGKLRITDATTGVGTATARQVLTTVAGQLYRVDLEFTRGTSTTGLAYVFGTSSSTPNGSKSSMATGAHSFYFVADSASTTIQVYASTGSSTTGQYNDYDNIKVRAVQARGHATDIEHVVGGDFTYNYSTWTKGTGWTIGSGVASSDGTQTAVSDLTLVSASYHAVRPGKVYDTSIQLTAYTAESVVFLLGGGAASVAGTSRSSVATFTEQLTVPAGSTIPLIRVRATADFVGSVDNVSVKLAANNSWTLDLNIQKNTYQQERRPSFDRAVSLDRSAAVYTFDGTETFHSFTTTIQDYQAYPFIDEWLASVEDGTSFTFDLFGTSTQPDNPRTMKLVSSSRTPAMTVAGNRAYRYQITLEEVPQ